MSAELFRVYLPAMHVALVNHKVARGLWEAAVYEAGGTPLPGGVTVRKFGDRIVIIGRATRT